jgi:hypothetical protein
MNSLLIITRFNETIESLFVQFAELFPSSSLGKNINLLNTLTSQTNDVIYDEDKNPLKVRPNKTMIDQFVLNVLEFKHQIDNFDESFFLSRNYDDKISKNSLNFVDEFKSIWSNLDNENKQVVFTVMQYLCELSLDYFTINNKLE